MPERRVPVDLPDPRPSTEIVASLGLRAYRGPKGCGVVVAVRLTGDNLEAVWEWADSKPRYRAASVPGGAAELCGLTLHPGGDRIPAGFGDWMARSRNGSFARLADDVFARDFTPVPVVLVISRSQSRCSACGKTALPDEAAHVTRCGYDQHEGCGARFTHVTTDTTGLGDEAKARAMRPDLEWMSYDEYAELEGEVRHG